MTKLAKSDSRRCRLGSGIMTIGYLVSVGRFHAKIAVKIQLTGLCSEICEIRNIEPSVLQPRSKFPSRGQIN